MREQEDNKISADAVYIAQNLAIPARQAIEAAERDAYTRHTHKPFGKFFPGAHAWFARKYGAEAAGAEAALAEARKRLKLNNAQDLDDAYLAELVEAEAQRAERARLYDESNIGPLSDVSAGILAAAFLVSVMLSLAALPIAAISIFLAGLIVGGIGMGVDEKRGSTFAKKSNEVGAAAKREFEIIRATGRSKVEALDAAINKETIASQTKYHSNEVVQYSASQSQQPLLQGGLAEKELQKRASQPDTPSLFKQ